MFGKWWFWVIVILGLIVIVVWVPQLILILLILSLVGLVVGLISPKLAIRWGSRRTRGRVLLTYGLAAVVFFILFGITAPPTQQPAIPPEPEVAQEVEAGTEEVAEEEVVPAEPEQEVVEPKPAPEETVEPVPPQPAEPEVEHEVVEPEPTPEAVPPEPEVEEVDKGHYSTLEVTDVSVSGDKVLISGRTDLPDGASVIVGFDVWGRSGSDLYIGVDEKTTVSKGEFTVTLSIPQRDEFKKGPYEVSVLFTPRGQSENVIELVGKDGENLVGELVNEAGSFKTMKLVEKRDLELSVTPPSYTFQLPSEFSQGSAERTLAEYVLAWKNQDWNRMVTFAQKTWVSVEPDPAGLLEAWYDFKTLKGFEIKDVKKVSEVATDITFIVQYEAVTNQISKKQIVAKVIKETAPYTPSQQGQWGVNPLSALRETDIN